MFPQVDRDEAEMKTDNPAPISFKKLKTTKSDTSGVGKVHCMFMRRCCWYLCCSQNLGSSQPGGWLGLS